MKNVALLCAAYLCGAKLNGAGEANEAIDPGVSKQRPRAAIISATGRGAGTPAFAVVSRARRQAPLNAGGRV
jgi:hypothetical protein